MRTKLFASLFALVPFTASAAVGLAGLHVMIDGQSVTFRDVSPNAWYATHIQAAAEQNIVSGDKVNGQYAGTFRPGDSVTFAEALKIAVEGAGYNEQAYGSTVSAGVGSHWASPYVAVAKAEHFAVADGSLRLDRHANRAEVASMFASAFKADTQVSPGNSFGDVTIATPYAADIEALLQAEVVSGDTDETGRPVGRFRPLEKINRAEVVKMVIEARAKLGTPGVDSTPTDTASSANAGAANAVVVIYTDDGFEPVSMTVKAGTTVTFKNESSHPMWVATDFHPEHTEYPGFDAARAIGSGDEYRFTFDRIGTWGFHNHLDPQFTGTIVVE